MTLTLEEKLGADQTAVELFRLIKQMGDLRAQKRVIEALPLGTERVEEVLREIVQEERADPVVHALREAQRHYEAVGSDRPIERFIYFLTGGRRGRTYHINAVSALREADYDHYIHLLERGEYGRVADLLSSLRRIDVMSEAIESYVAPD